jgi:hypothetical protein
LLYSSGRCWVAAAASSSSRQRPTSSLELSTRTECISESGL